MKKYIVVKISSVFGFVKPIVVILIIFLALLSVARSIHVYRVSSARISSAQDKLDAVRAEQEEIKRQLELVRSDYYKEREIRNKFGLGKEGEISIILPDEEILRRLSPRRLEPEAQNFTAKPNWKLWVELFF